MASHNDKENRALVANHSLSSSKFSLSSLAAGVSDENIAGNIKPQKIPTAPIAKLKLYSSYEDLPASGKKTKVQFIRSQSCSNISVRKYQTSHRYDFVQSKIKKYMGNTKKPDIEISSPPPVTETVPKNADQGQIECLAAMNKRLYNELQEKNEILQKMQESYENLLLKYAEAQNRIDQLRLGTVLTENTQSVECVKQTRDPEPSTSGSKPKQRLGKDKRPDTLQLDTNVLIIEKSNHHAVTPTDSDISSVKTSISGHSKILNNFESRHNEDPCLTEEVLRLSDDFNYDCQPSGTFDKVKEWQNSLPPLELIETPENNSYDIPPLTTTPSTNYRDIQRNITKSEVNQKTVSQEVMKKYLRTLSLPSSLSRRNLLSMVYKQKSHHTIDICLPSTSNNDTTKYQIPNSSTSSFHQFSKPGKFRNNIFIPSLDLDNLTLSDDETTRGHTVDSSLAKTNTPDSLFTDSVNSCKATISQYTDKTKPLFHKSTSITPERSKDMFYQVAKDNINNDKLVPTTHQLYSNCHICGELYGNDMMLQPNRSTSCQGLPNDSYSYFSKSIKGTKQTLNRSVSFTSDASSLMCLHDVEFKSEEMDKFDVYTSNLKARSQVIMKALTAHVNNS